MDINTLRGISTIFVMIAFFGVCWWAFSPRRKQRFKEAANLPFADDDSDTENHSEEIHSPRATTIATTIATTVATTNAATANEKRRDRR